MVSPLSKTVAAGNCCCPSYDNPARVVHENQFQRALRPFPSKARQASVSERMERRPSAGSRASTLEDSRIGVFLCDAGRGGSAFISRKLYLPTALTGHRVRWKAAGIPEPTQFARKPQIARSMFDGVTDAGVPYCWVKGE